MKIFPDLRRAAAQDGSLLLPANRFVLGSDSPPVAPLRLRAGPLTMLFEPHTAFLRWVLLGSTEVIRGIYAAVRDRNWRTVPTRILNLGVDDSTYSFRIRFDADCRDGDIHFRWHGRIIGTAAGVVTCVFDGQAQSSFLRNRIGFCVLHTIQACAGARARCERIDGRTVEMSFPDRIEPQIVGQARFRDMRALAHEVRPGLWVALRFHGDAFEMEDQRNWTDASFKTYCTPLALPFPVEVQAGTRIRQAVTLRLVGPSPRPAGPEHPPDIPAPGSVAVLVPSQSTSRLPRLGLGMATHEQPLDAREIQRLKALRLAHLRADVRLVDPDWPDVIERAIDQTRQTATTLELALHLPPEIDESLLKRVSRVLRGARISLARIIVFRQTEPATSSATLRAARAYLGALGAPIGGGSDAHFCELNREHALGRFGLAEAEFVSWPITPQVHASDGLSVMETLAALPDTVASAGAFAGDRPLVVSPITLKPRFNAVATADARPSPPEELPPEVDPRQISLFAAVWTLGTLARLAASPAVRSLTHYETTGWRGVMETAGGCPLPDKFPSVAGAVFPVYHVLAAVAGFERVAPVSVSDPATLAALALFDALGRRRVLLANLTAEHQVASLQGQATRLSAQILDQTNVESAMGEPEKHLAQAGRRLECGNGIFELGLNPYAFAWFELE